MADDFQLFTSLRFDWELETLGDCRPGNWGWNSDVSSPAYMLDYHRDRMLRAATHWGWTKAIDTINGPEGLDRLHRFLLDTLEQNLGDSWGPDCNPMRVKILLSKDGDLSLEHNTVPATTLANLFPDRLIAPGGCDDPRNPSENLVLGSLSLTPPYDVYIDVDLTSPSDFTHFKTTKRNMYDQARQRAGLKMTDTTKEVLIANSNNELIMEGSLTTPYFWRDGGWITPPVSKVFEEGKGAGGQDGTTRRWALERKLAVEGLVYAADVLDGEAVWLSNGVRGFVFGKVHRPAGNKLSKTS